MQSALFLLLALPALAHTLPTAAQQDPTKLCYPNQSTFTIYVSKTGATSTWSIDHNKQLLGGGAAGYHLVRDYAHAMDYLSTENTDGSMSCTSTPTNPGDMYFYQCLPSNATKISDAVMGYGAGALSVQTWEVPSPIGNFYESFQLVGDVMMPVFYKDPRVIDGIYVYYNLSPAIIDPLVFQVPDNCPPKVAV